MGFFHWIGSRVSGYGRREVARQLQSDGRVPDDKPADKVVRHLFVQISQGEPRERRAWIKLAKYLARQGTARPADLMRS